MELLYLIVLLVIAIMQIGIFGIGSIGSVLAKYLLENQAHSYFYFNRNYRSETRILFEDKLSIIPLAQMSNKEPMLDWLIICLKEYHYSTAISEIIKLVQPHTKLAIFRNGIRLSSNVLDIISQDRILETIIDCPTQRNDKGEYMQLRKPKIIIPKSNIGSEFKSIFALSDINVIESTSFLKQQWEKLIESASLGAIQTITNKPCVIFQKEKWYKLYQTLIDEGIKVALSDGVTLDPKYKLTILKRLKTYPPEKGSSMLSDKLVGNQIEVDAKTGAIVKVAKENGIKIPATMDIYNSLILL